jgi:hypothetical protein
LNQRRSADSVVKIPQRCFEQRARAGFDGACLRLTTRQGVLSVCSERASTLNFI